MTSRACTDNGNRDVARDFLRCLISSSTRLFIHMIL
ncbi:hypothetical protein MGSAQ_002451 [marine sediment metagenome]|uniref:Uncharacterized protein n=1 Tax=marine sediment metagenome TaxID=412755 RepID=A0A1B6NSZ6_9ZZZZ